MSSPFHIEVHREYEDWAVLISGNHADILDAGDDYILAQCDLADLANEAAQVLPDDLTIQIHSQDGFGTFLFHELELTASQSGLALSFKCLTPNKYWEGQFGLATFLAAIRDQAMHHDNWKITYIELEDDWKSIILERIIVLGDPLVGSIEAAAKTSRSFFTLRRLHYRGLTGKTNTRSARIYSVVSFCPRS